MIEIDSWREINDLGFGPIQILILASYRRRLNRRAGQVPKNCWILKFKSIDFTFFMKNCYLGNLSFAISQLPERFFLNIVTKILKVSIGFKNKFILLVCDIFRSKKIKDKYSRSLQDRENMFCVIL